MPTTDQRSSGSPSKKNGWRTSAECPICAARSKCGISLDDSVVLCWHQESPKQANNGAYYHFLSDGRDRTHAKTSLPSSGEVWCFPATDDHKRPKTEFRQLFLTAFVRARKEAKYLTETAARRSVTIESLFELACHHDYRSAPLIELKVPLAIVLATNRQ